MNTNISEPKLTELRTQGMHADRRFVDPAVLQYCTMVLAARGKQWAASVLGRDLSRRSVLVPAMPYLRDGEEYTLVLADAEENAVTLAALADCTCVFACADDPATVCSLSGEWHVHPASQPGFGPCPTHPAAPGDL